MNLLPAIIHFVADDGGDTVTVDTKGIVTHSPIWPETSELIYGTLASLIIFALLVKYAGPAIMKAMRARTERIQKELDGAASDKASAEQEAIEIREAKGDIAAERERLLAEARQQAEAMIIEGTKRVDDEMAELRARAEAEIVASKARVTDELRAEIAHLSGAAAERAVAETLDDQTLQDLIESFIQEVGASA